MKPAIFAIALAATALASAPAAGDAHADGAKDCLMLGRVDRTEIIDDRNIVFFMRNGDIYRNRLPRACPSLETEDAFMYRTSMNRLCDLDSITVLRDWGFGLAGGPSCGLGEFQPIDEDAVDAMQEADS